MEDDKQIMTGNNQNVIGTYSVSVKSFFDSWKQKASKPEMEKKGKKTLKPIIHPIFEKCANLTDDKFWQYIFMDCSRGKFPRNFMFKNNLLTYRKTNKMFRLTVSNSPSEVFTATIDFFQSHGGIMSAQDRQRIKKQEEDKLLIVLDHEITWKDIKTDKLKDILIGEFVLSLTQEYQLNEEERRDLITTIRKGFMLKYFTSSNIEMEEGRIKEIDGLIIDEETNESSIDSDFISGKPIKQCLGLGVEIEDLKPEINFLENWEKYLVNLENKRTKKTHTHSSSYSVQNESEDFTISRN